MLDIIREMKLSRENQLIFGVSLEKKHCESTIHGKTFLPDSVGNIIKAFPSILILLPSLRERISEIPVFIFLCLQSLATESVYRLSGMEPEGINYMEAYPWEGNYKQFRRLIDMLVESSSGTYLRTEDVLAALETEKAIGNSPSFNTDGAEINIDQPLSDIIRDVIKILLKREGMTKTKAAEHLNICRTTLWKYIR